jgi:hypothetical protein
LLRRGGCCVVVWTDLCVGAVGAETAGALKAGCTHTETRCLRLGLTPTLTTQPTLTPTYPSTHPSIHPPIDTYRYMKKKKTLQRHRAKCELRHPPGDEIYRDGNLSVFEVRVVFVGGICVVCVCVCWGGGGGLCVCVWDITAFLINKHNIIRRQSPRDRPPHNNYPLPHTHRWTGSRTSCTARTSASWPSSSSTTRPSTTTWSVPPVDECVSVCGVCVSVSV